MKRTGYRYPPAASPARLGRDRKIIHVYDLRNRKKPNDKKVETSSDFNDFCEALYKAMLPTSTLVWGSGRPLSTGGFLNINV